MSPRDELSIREGEGGASARRRRNRSSAIAPAGHDRARTWQNAGRFRTLSAAEPQFATRHRNDCWSRVYVADLAGHERADGRRPIPSAATSIVLDRLCAMPIACASAAMRRAVRLDVGGLGESLPAPRPASAEAGSMVRQNPRRHHLLNELETVVGRTRSRTAFGGHLVRFTSTTPRWSPGRPAGVPRTDRAA